MSSSCLNYFYRSLFLSAALVVCIAAPTHAADGYVVPEVTLGGERRTNPGLITGSRQEIAPSDKASNAYLVEGLATLGLRSQRGLLEARPGVSFERHPDDDVYDSDKYYLKVRSNYLSLKSSFDFQGRFEQEKSYTSELVSAAYDEFDPQDPIVSGTGRVLTEATVKRFQLRPTYLYRFTPRTGVGISVVEDSKRYTGAAGFGGRNYDFYQANPYVMHSLSQRTDLQVGAFVSRFKRTDRQNTTDAYGVSFDLKQRWTPVFTTIASIKAERDTIDQAGSARDKTSPWSAVLTAEKRGEIDLFRMTVGRSLWPSASGYKTQADELRFGYKHPITQRLAFDGAVRGLKVRNIGGAIGANDRDVVVGELSLTWLISRHWSMLVSYDYTSQKFISDDTKAHDHGVTLGFNLSGLGPQKR